MKKKILLVLILLLLSGCSVNYDLVINPDSTIDEKVLIEVDESKSNIDSLKDIIKSYNIDKKNYSIKKDIDDIIITYKKNYNSVEDYILNGLYKQVFEDIDIEKTKNKTSLSTTADFSPNTISINKDNLNNSINYLQVNIKSELPIISENADTMNADVYTWIYNGKQLSKDINITFNNVPNKIRINSIIIISLIVFSILLMILIIYSRFKQKQKF